MEDFDVNNARMETWLDEHADFAHRYFVRKASRETVNAWFVERCQSIQPSSRGSVGFTPSSPSPASSTSIPVRKISASEFDRPLRPMVVKDAEGAMTFLSDTQHLQTKISAHTDANSSRCQGRALEKGDCCARLLDLVKDVSSHLDVATLCHRIFLHTHELIAADRYSLFLVAEDAARRKFLTSFLFDVAAEGSTLERAATRRLRLEWNKGIVGYVAATGKPLNICDAYKDPRFNAEVDLITGYKTQSILCMPIKNHKDEVVGVAQAINKKCGENGVFTQQDEKDFSSYLAFSGIVLYNAQLYETSQLENRRNQVLLGLASVIFEEQQRLETLLTKITHTLVIFMQAQACTIFITDTENMDSFSSVFYMDCEEVDGKVEITNRMHDASKIDYMYAQYAKSTKETLNIPDVTKDQRFPWNSDHAYKSSKPIKSVLCTPICNTKKDKIIGVCQLVNKTDKVCVSNWGAFNRNDEDFLEAFAIFCGLGIHNTQLYEAEERARAKQAVTLEVLSYHASAAVEESQALQVTGSSILPSTSALHLQDFSFSDFDLSDMETTQAAVRILLDLGLTQTFHMSYMSVCQWVVSVRKNYRKGVAYHNWRHALNTAQCMFALMLSGKLQVRMNDLEVLALVIAALCHDLDHRGLNNSFIKRSDHPLSHLYCHSTMEHHHFDQCLMILNSPGSQILSGLSLEEYKTTLKMVEEAILATDLAVYIKRRTDFFALVDGDQFDWKEPRHRTLLRSMLMTACDISAITKPWPVQKRIAELVATEFFEQGDKERRELNIEPIDLMNRDKKDQIPNMQLSFIDAICSPLYESLSSLSPDCMPLLDGLRKNRLHWQQLAQREGSGLEKEEERNELKDGEL